MKIIKNVLLITLISTILIVQIPYCSFAISTSDMRAPIKVGSLIYSFDDLFLSQLKQDLENIQKENPDKVEFTFFDGKANPAIQFQIIDSLIQDNFDLLILNMVEKRQTEYEDIILKAKAKNIPLILYISDTSGASILKTYAKAVIMTPELSGPGIAEGKILVDAWNTDKSIDKNKDNTLQYIMLQGRPDSEQTIARTKYSVQTLNDAGIKTQLLTNLVGNWSQELARNLISSIFLQYSNKIEAIISNNDAMAIGAIEALQQYGYNKGAESKFIPVVGIDALPKARELIDQGVMTGSVLQDSRAIAEALYNVGLNLASNEAPTKGTDYVYNDSVITIPLQYQPYIKTSAS